MIAERESLAFKGFEKGVAHHARGATPRCERWMQRVTMRDEDAIGREREHARTNVGIVIAREELKFRATHKTDFAKAREFDRGVFAIAFVMQFSAITIDDEPIALLRKFRKGRCTRRAVRATEVQV